MTDNQKRPLGRYPNAFMFGTTLGMVVSMFQRTATVEPLCARPFAYLKVALFFGFSMSYWDWHRRNMLEQVLYSDQEIRYHNMMKAVNEHVRYGEEDEIQNLTEYLAGASTRA